MRLLLLFPWRGPVFRAVVGPWHGAFEGRCRPEDAGVFIRPPDDLDACRHAVLRETGRYRKDRTAAQHIERILHAPGQRVRDDLAIRFTLFSLARF